MNYPDSTVFLNGRFLPRSQATLDIEDRGTLFADGVYEVIRCYRGKPLAIREHVARLNRSMAAIELQTTPDIQKIESINQELLTRNKLTDAKVYWQVTRGAAPRDHAFPTATPPTVLMIAYRAELFNPTQPPREIVAVVAEDERWHRCDIKSLMLLANVLAKNRAMRAGAQEAILHREGVVTEGTATNVMIVRDGQLITHPADRWILPGITRGIIFDLARKSGVTVNERPFSVDELMKADEVMTAGSTTHIAAVVRIDGRQIGDGHAGPVTRRLNQLLLSHIDEVCPA